MTPIHTHDPQKTAGREGWGCLRGDCARHSLADHESQGREDGPPVGFLPRRLALFSPVTRAGLQRSAHFPNSNPCLGRPPSTCTARHGVERSLGLRHAASHRVVSVLRLDAHGRVLSAARQRDCGMNWHWLRRFRETKLGKLLSTRRKLRSAVKRNAKD